MAVVGLNCRLRAGSSFPSIILHHRPHLFCVARFRKEMLCFDLRCVCKLLVLLPSTFNADLHS